jgi:tRNA 2-thiouridine synthesizing protein A
MIRTIGGFGDSRSMVQKTLDLRGLKCPLPALYTRKALAGLAPGDVLFVSCTDPLAGIDIPNLVRETGDVPGRYAPRSKADGVPHPQNVDGRTKPQ